MDRLTLNVVNTLLDWGADLVGIAPVERFADAPEGHKPTDFLPECKSVISIAMHIFQGMGDVWGEYDEPGKTITPYLFYGYGLTNIESSRLSNRMAKQLEYLGYKTLCFMPTWTCTQYKYFEEMVQANEYRAEFSHRHAAVAAGIAEFGWSGLALTPEFGAMQRYNSILTSAELEPTPLYDGPALCQKDKCNTKCARICPADAISENKPQSLTIDGRRISYGVHDNVRCVYAIVGMIKGSGGRSEVKIPDGPGRLEHFYADYRSDKINTFDRKMLDNCFGIICGDFCGKCLHQCPSKSLSEKEIKDHDLSRRHSSLNRALLI